MNLTKIKMKDGEVIIHGEEVASDGTTTKKIELTSQDPPRPEFGDRLQEMHRPALAMLGAPVEWMADAKVSGVTIKHEEERGIGCVVTMLIDRPMVSSSPLVINTPYLVEDAGDGGLSMPGDLYRALMALIDEASRFVRGDRAQADMFASVTIESEGAPTITAGTASAIRKARGRARELN